MTEFIVDNHILTWTRSHETLSVRPWGPNAVRVCSTRLAEFPDVPGALLDEPPAGAAPQFEVTEEAAILTNGGIRVEMSSQGGLRFFNARTGEVLLEEPVRMFWSYPARNFEAAEGGLYHLEALFAAKPGASVSTDWDSTSMDFSTRRAA